MIKNGLYGLVSLNGAPLDRADCATLGLAVPVANTSVAVGLRDESAEVADSSIGETGEITVAFLGYLDDKPGLAAALARPAATEPALLVLAALERWGDAAFARLRGEWSLLLFDRRERVLHLAVSETMRDQMYFACDGTRVAIAPQAATLARLAWVGGEFDPLGLICSMGRWSFRKQREGRTFLRNVTSVECGTVHRIDGLGRRRTVFAAQPAFDPWNDSYEDAIAALEAETRTAIRRHLHRHQSAAVMLSGGLDSSLIALLAMEEKRPGQRLFALSSVAPDGSGLRDEREFMEIVGHALGLPVTYLSPSADSNAYRPPANVFAHAEEPVVGQRHYLYGAFYDAAQREGATLLLDGVFGEMALTRAAPQATFIGRYRRLRTNARRIVTEAIHPPRWPHEGLLVTLSPWALELLAQSFGTRPIKLTKVFPVMRPDQPLGLAAAYFKSGKVATATWQPSVRQVYPYRDRALLQLAARFPSRFTEGLGLPRSLARAIMRDRLPDRIVMRNTKDVFSPDFHRRLMRQAPAARERLALHRSNGAADWLDLDWAEGQLAALGAGGSLVGEAWSRIQSTVIAAEFFTWWADAMRADSDQA
ncbi:asparagine synthetase B family protein [Sphingomonas sp. LB-2]|uniref:asparagine synthase-related protein n=1 Tax=Sphingomonas caeni TaxID=2984949 RepID=UPI00222E337F|nr:asparagine synthetase B family protein [Sphingomonas caeni]MCW3848070.1 asparagine synthetase B family protein [Sphingomonas caeni]